MERRERCRSRRKTRSGPAAYLDMVAPTHMRAPLPRRFAELRAYPPQPCAVIPAKRHISAHAAAHAAHAAAHATAHAATVSAVEHRGRAVTRAWSQTFVLTTRCQRVSNCSQPGLTRPGKSWKTGRVPCTCQRSAHVHNAPAKTVACMPEAGRSILL